MHVPAAAAQNAAMRALFTCMRLRAAVLPRLHKFAQLPGAFASYVQTCCCPHMTLHGGTSEQLLLLSYASVHGRGLLHSVPCSDAI